MYSLVGFLDYLLRTVGTDIRQALVLLYLAKWTHRDVSVGNIIVVEIDGSVRGKLSDLEYAKKFSDETFSVDPKTVCFPYILTLNLM
jgi:hypothetical protein